MPGVSVYTTPHNFLKAGYPRASHAFDHIIGMQTGFGERLWSDYVSPGDSTPRAKPVDAEELVLPLDETQAVKLLQFFKDWFVDPRPLATQINCHYFARWMSDNHNGTVDTSPMLELIKNGVSAQTLVVGQVGLLGFKLKGAEIAMHSLIGLGVDNPKCLQVMATDGYLATAEYGLVHDYNSPIAAREPIVADIVGYNLYTAQTPL